MTLSNEELLRKATLTTTDFGGAGEAPLSFEQVTEFLRVAITPQAMLPDVRTVSSAAAKWQESKLEFGSRIMKPGVEATRLAAGDQVKPTTGIVEISTVLIRGEVPISDEVMEDNVARAGFGDVLTSMVAEAAGRDVEELFINGDTASGDPYLALQEGWLDLVAATGNTVAAAAFGQDYQEIFKQLLVAIPDRFKRDLATNGRFYVPQRLVEKYRDILAARGTPLGDLMLTGSGEVRYQSILLKGVPMSAIVAGTPDTCRVLLTHRLNLYAGYHRMIKLESWRDPREGATSFVVTARVNSQVAHTPAASIATSVSVEP